VQPGGGGNEDSQTLSPTLEFHFKVRTSGRSRVRPVPENRPTLAGKVACCPGENRVFPNPQDSYKVSPPAAFAPCATSTRAARDSAIAFPMLT
jgi:hypothetical protein